jgi:hypothetical protein
LDDTTATALRIYIGERLSWRDQMAPSLSAVRIVVLCERNQAPERERGGSAFTAFVLSANVVYVRESLSLCCYPFTPHFGAQRPVRFFVISVSDKMF